MFCLEYFRTGNASESARVAKYSPKTAAVIGRENLQKPQIQARLQQLRQKIEDASIMDVTERKQRLTEIARARLTDFMELGQDGSWVNIGPEVPMSGAIQEIRSRTEYDDDGSKPTVYTSVKLHNPLNAIDLLNKMDKIYTDGVGVQVNIDNRKVEAQIVNFDANKVAQAIIEAIRLGLDSRLLGGDGHGEDAALLSSSTDVQATSVSKPQN